MAVIQVWVAVYAPCVFIQMESDVSVKYGKILQEGVSAILSEI